jgi:hypothetical protein
MSVRSRTLSRHGGSSRPHITPEQRFQEERARTESREPRPREPEQWEKEREYSRGHESHAQRFARDRATAESKPKTTGIIGGIKRLAEHLIPTKKEEPSSQVYRSPRSSRRSKREQKPQIGVIGGAVKTVKDFGKEAYEEGKEQVRGVKKRQKEYGDRDGLGEALGIKGVSADGKQRVNEHGYVEIRGRDGQWIFTGKKAKFKIGKTGYDEATGLEYEVEQDGEGGGEEKTEGGIGSGVFGKATIGGGGEPSRRKTRVSREERRALKMGGMMGMGAPEAAEAAGLYAAAPAQPAWHSGVTGENLPTRGEYEPIIGSGLGVMSTGLFQTNYNQPRPIVTTPPYTPRAQIPSQQMSRRDRRETMREMVAAPAQANIPMPAPPMMGMPQEPIIGSGLNALASGMFPMTYNSQQPQPTPQPVVIIREVPVQQSAGKKKGRKGVPEETIVEEIVVPPAAPLAPPTNRPAYSAFNEVFGDRGLQL